MDASVDAEEYSLYYSTSNKLRPLEVSLHVNQVDMTMKVDTGATLSVISEQTYDHLWPKELAPPLRPSPAKLRTYTGERIAVKGTIDVNVIYQKQESQLGLLVVASIANGTGLDQSVPARLEATQPHIFRTCSTHPRSAGQTQ